MNEAPRLAQMHGIVILNKPSGPSSAHCLVAFKRQGQKKIGHAGTLDPMASGVLPVLLGAATKLSGWLLQNSEKIYSGTLRLGVETDTWDMEGKIVTENSCGHVTAEAAAQAVASWLDLREQEVPAYSAAKHNGQPLYKLARKGQDTPVKVKSVKILEADMLDFSMPFVKFRVRCGSGAYMRSLAHSLGMRLGCGAALQNLTREYSQPFAISQSVSLEEVEAGLAPAHVAPLFAALPHWPRIQLNAAQARAARQGMPVADMSCKAPYAFLCQGELPIAIARSEGPMWQVERGLWN